MRSMLRSVLVALVAVFAFGAVVSASASAELPEFVRLHPPVSVSAESGEVTLQPAKTYSKDVTRCQASHKSGSVVEKKTMAKFQIQYTGCKITVGTKELACSSKGATAEEIVTSDLSSELVYTNKAAKEVGLVTKPEAAGGAVAEYTCKGTILGTIKLAGSVIAKLPSEQVNKSKTSFTWDYRQKAGIQEPTEYEEGATKISAFLTSVLAGSSEQTGEEATETMTFGEPVEIRA